MTQFEFYKSVQFVLELLIAEGLFLWRLKRKNLFPLRLIAAVAAVFLFAWLLPVPVQNAFYTSFVFLVIFGFTLLAAKLLFRESWVKLLFCCLAGYTVQHLAYELYNLALLVMNVSVGTSGLYGSHEVQPFPNAFIAIVYFFLYIVIYFFAEFLFGKRIEGDEPLRLRNGTIVGFCALLLVIDVILNAVVMYNLADGAGNMYLIVVAVYNIICCAIVLFLQFEVALRRRLEDTLRTVEHLRHQEKEQYETSKENIALINMKCHDLKHQIRTIGGRSLLSEDELHEMEELINIYDSTVRTGNEALDVILTEKSLLCTKNHIRFSLIVDGKQLDFMRAADIYSLFGNLVDNAIEAAMSLEEGKRVIGLRVKAVGNMISVNMHNYYDKELRFENGVPSTTKAEKEYHGYGLKSVRYLCERYHGDLSITTDNHVFVINILFPLKEIEDEDE